MRRGQQAHRDQPDLPVLPVHRGLRARQGHRGSRGLPGPPERRGLRARQGRRGSRDLPGPPVLKGLRGHRVRMDRAAHRQFLDRMGSALPEAWQHLIKVTDDCTGCGICELVCPSASIRIVDGNAVFHPGKCETCFACIHACPQKAIALTIPEKNPQARFRNENISLQEIIDSNHQTNRRYDNEQ